MTLKRQLGLSIAIIIVVASMFGTGIFITTGNVLQKGQSAPLILILWGVGGIIALFGALSYAELASMWPEVGGDYIYLKKMIGLLPAFLTGWISLVVGFSASIATSSITFVEYINAFWSNTYGVPLLATHSFQKSLAAFIILLTGAIHIHGVKIGSTIQFILTGLKLLFIIVLLILGLSFVEWAFIGRLSAVYSPAVAQSPAPSIPTVGLILLIIMFSYSGWNGATYISGEIKNPGKNIPRSLIIGTLITVVIYLALNSIFLLSSPGEELMTEGKIAVGAVAVKNLFGTKTANFFMLGISLILLSSISVQMMIGPRVYYAMAMDGMTFKCLKRVNKRFETPSLAILIQIIISIIYVIFGNAPFLLEYMGFALGIFPIVTVSAMVYYRVKFPQLYRPYRTPFFPFIPVIFILISTAMMISGFLTWTYPSVIAIGVVLLGVPVYFIWKKMYR